MPPAPMPGPPQAPNRMFDPCATNTTASATRSTNRPTDAMDADCDTTRTNLELRSCSCEPRLASLRSQPSYLFATSTQTTSSTWGAQPSRPSEPFALKPSRWELSPG